jgi:DNA adenine methylase
MATMTRKKIAFGWYGGKYSHLEWLLGQLPDAHHYCEPFGGSAAVLLNRDPAPVETYNDVDGEVVNFFRVLREQKDELIYAIGMTPFAREEFYQAILTNGNGHDLSPLERARRFFIRARQVRTGLAQTASVGRWANCLQTSRAGMAGAVSRWLGSVEGLEWIATRLLRVQIENDLAVSVIRRYDSPETLFYCDPPYPHDSRGDSKAYQYEMTDLQHMQLYEVVSQVKGKIAISGYHGTLMDGLYKGWNVHEEGSKKAHSIKAERSEVLWTNY